MSEEQPNQSRTPTSRNSFHQKLSPMERRLVQHGGESAKTTARWNATNCDQEVLVDSQSPLIIVNDSNLSTPTAIGPSSYNPRRSFLTSSGGPRPSMTQQLSRISQTQEPSGMSDREEVESEYTPGPREEIEVLSKKSRASIFSPMKISAMEEQDSIDIFEDQGVKTEKKAENKVQEKLRNLLESTNYSILVAIFTVYTLFGDNFRVICFGASSDNYFSIGSLIALGVFSVEILITVYAKKDYLWSFFFWLDIISTVSIMFDVHFIASGIFPDSAASTVQLARASRASRVGTKAGRVVKIVRIMRLTKLYKEINKNHDGSILDTTEKGLAKVHPIQERRESQSKRGSMRGDPNVSPGTRPLLKKLTLNFKSGLSFKTSYHKQIKKIVKGVSTESALKGTTIDPNHGELKESRVGKKLSDLTTKRVIIIVLLTLLLVPMFSAEFFSEAPPSGEYEVDLLEVLLRDPVVSPRVQQSAIDYFINSQKDTRTALVYIASETGVLYINFDVSLTKLRDDEKTEFSIKTLNYGDMKIVYSARHKAVITAILDILKTLFICFLLTIGALLFSKDANDLVLRPIERMIEKVNKIARNPLEAKEHKMVQESDAGFQNETVQIENAIIKIGGLLALGFGEAGSTIIANNMANSGDLNPMLPGKKKMAIFGFCDIRNFTDATEVLQEGVMVFVNSIADIVHSRVDKYTGAANKNIGDAFLLVWKFPDELVYQDEEGNVELEEDKVAQNMANFSLISFLKIYARINRDPTLEVYNNHPGLNVRLPNYRVKMGFGLHLGWAIEGAIGSEFKVDASYLSPNVNMASRLEAATKQYGVPLLFSGDLYKYLSPELRSYSRLIDIVTVKGSIKPIEIYTIEMDATNFEMAKEKLHISNEAKRLRQKGKKEAMKYLLNVNSTAYMLENDKELRHLLRNHNPEFEQNFNDGFATYISGDWATAKKKFAECLEKNPDDGPTKNLYSLLEENNFIAPEEWQGYHVLTEK